MKKIYSLNLLCYITLKTGIRPVMCIKDKLYYGTFLEETEEINKAIEEYKDSTTKVNLHDYLNLYKQYKKEIESLRRTRHGL